MADKTETGVAFGTGVGADVHVQCREQWADNDRGWRDKMDALRAEVERLRAALRRLIAACEREDWDEPDADLDAARAACQS